MVSRVGSGAGTAAADVSGSESGVGANDTGAASVDELSSATRIVPPPHAASAASGIKNAHHGDSMNAPLSGLARRLVVSGGKLSSESDPARMGRSRSQCDVDHPPGERGHSHPRFAPLRW